MVLKIVAIIALGYFLGAIPSGLIIGKLARGVDVRQYGSGRIGFANVLRAAGGKAGAATFCADVGKGALAAFLGGVVFGGTVATAGSVPFDIHGAQALGAAMAIVGHNWPVYTRFDGGRGVDTALGGLMAMCWWAGLGCLAIGLAIIFISRYVSVGSMLGTFSSVVILAGPVAVGYQPVEYLIYGAVATALVVFQHRDNIGRLRAGTERKLGQKADRRAQAQG
ncbi:MAG: glycerol-3-phosphate 1-O-acyltransferase PlsY [Dehalococcoidia bacterium]